MVELERAKGSMLGPYNINPKPAGFFESPNRLGYKDLKKSLLKIARAQQALSYLWPSRTGSKRIIAKPEPNSSPITRA